MQPEFWQQRWQDGRIGFHQFAIDDNLKRFWEPRGFPEAAAVFVPLCGKSLDLLWLRNRGHRVIGVELSDIALQAFCMENGIAARRRALTGLERYEAANLELYRGDFFALTPALLGNLSAIYDRAALISWTPDLRSCYVEHMTRLTQPGSKTLLIALEYPQSQFPGPPFSVDADEVDRLYSPQHEIQELARRDVLAREPRMQARGVSRLSEVCYRITRV